MPGILIADDPPTIHRTIGMRRIDRDASADDGRPAASRLMALERSQPLARALLHMQRNFHRSDLRLTEVASIACVSPSHLAALMRQQLGHGYLEHLTQLRIERAKLLLQSTDLTVAAIALAVGYETPAPFYYRFKLFVGLTPMAFRNQMLG